MLQLKGILSAVTTVLEFCKLIAGIFRDEQLRADGRRQVELGNLKETVKALKEDAKINSTRLDPDSVYRRLRARREHNDD